jgi:eukaryotic-like serine/threonine-protein kinase
VRPWEVVRGRGRVSRRPPGQARRHIGLGGALAVEGKLSEAVAECREAIRLNPDLAEAHNNLGNALGEQAKWAEAAAEYREAIRLKPDLAAGHLGKGTALQRQGKLVEAAPAFREAIRLDPRSAEAHCNLGLVLMMQGDPAGALPLLRRGHELGTRRPGWRNPSAQWIADAERDVMEARLSALVKGEVPPEDAAERLAMARMCAGTRRFATAARLWAEILAADPERMSDPGAANRYEAAGSAAMAGAGKGEKEPPLDLREKAQWRSKAVEWLRADLSLRADRARGATPEARAEVGRALGAWKADPRFAGIRDAAAIRSLPVDEQATCRALWAEVDALLARLKDGRP